MNRPRVLLLWPGADAGAGGNFGVPQLVLMASYAQARTNARVDIRDLECERAFGQVSLPKIFEGDDGRGYDVIAFGCYSSFDYLKCLTMAELARTLWPNAVIAAGGYHVSARPDDIVFDGSPFDVAVIGEGEHALVQIIESVSGGEPLRGKILDSSPVLSLDELPPSDWSLLSRYRGVARQVATQAQVYLSRGCPFDCAFCMERAKREVSWRGLSVERAIDEIKRLHAFLDLRGWTVYLADALFGMKTSWRRAFLERLAQENLPVEKFWLLIRVDLVQDEDLELFQRANCGLGFGLESGIRPCWPSFVKLGGSTIISRECSRSQRDLVRIDLPWGANVICGHPGETEATLRTSAAYLRKLFLDPKGTTGFLSVDPFRLYPGSPIDAERSAWSARFGTRFHRPRWWHDGDQEFLAEWVDPSSELTYRRRAQLQHELLAPVVHELAPNFVYRGRAREYFMRAVDEQIALTQDRTRFHYVERYYAWNRYLGRSTYANDERANDQALKAIAARMRAPAIEKALTWASGTATRNEWWSAIQRALMSVPRELFVPLDEIAASVRDEPVALDETNMATVSAMHAYAMSFFALEIQPGDHVLDLGAGTGYGTALLDELVGPTGSVAGVEVDPALVDRASAILAHRPSARIVTGNALDPREWPTSPEGGFTKVTVGFAIDGIPDSWRDALPMGARVVAPVRHGSDQFLVHATLTSQGWALTRRAQVVYVPARTPEQVAASKPSRGTSTSSKVNADSAEKVRLPLAPR
ncbi:MAG: cobalamin-dependent protein [Polyangiaceae bacterium]